MSESVTNDLLHELMKAMPQRFDRLEHTLREQAAAAAEEREHLRLLMRTTGRHEDAFASVNTRLDRIERRLDLVGQP